MKILFVDFALDKLGGVERVVSTLANELIEKYEVKICSVYKYNEQPFYKYDERISFSYLIDNSRLLSTKSSKKIVFYCFRAIEKLVEKTYYKKRIENYCESQLVDVDVVVFCRTIAAVTFLPFMKNYKGKVIVRDAIHLHDTTASVKKRMKEFFPDKVDTFIVSSEESLKLYKDFFEDRIVNIVKIYNPLGICPKERCSCESKKIIGVGRYCKQKGFESLIYAFALVSKRHTDWSLALIGAGEDAAYYKRICKRLGLGDKVEFRKSNDIVEEYSNADIFVMSSRNEGYANALVEALACGVPSITFDWYVGADDIIKNGINGIIVPLVNRERYFKGQSATAADIEHLAGVIEKLIEDKDFRKSISLNAKKIIDGRERSKIVNEWINIIEGID